jgi:hypothetical protein
MRWIVACLSYLLVAATLVTLSMMDGPVGWLLRQLQPNTEIEPWREWITRVAAFVLALGLFWLARGASRRHWWSRQRFEQAPGRPLIPLSDIREANREILQAMVRVGQKYNGSTLRLFGQMLVDPARYQVRITDEFEQVGACLRVTVSTTFTSFPGELDDLRRGSEEWPPIVPRQRSRPSAVPARIGSTNGGGAVAIDGSRAAQSLEDRASARPETVSAAGRPVMLVPLIMATKGTMLDNIDTFDGGAEAVPFLSQEETRGIVAHVVQALFEDAFGQGHKPVLFALLRLVFRPGRVSVRDAQAYFDQVVVSVRGDAEAAKLTKLRGVCSFLVRNYVVIAEVSTPSGYKWVLRYTKTTPHYGQVYSLASRWRVRLGLPPNRFVIPLNLPFTANSYHFRMQAGQNSYVKMHSVQWAKSGRVVRQKDIRAMSEHAYLRVRHRQALPYAHLYTRRFDTCTNPKDLVMEVVLEEVPPGALGLTFWLAAISASVITLLSFAVPTSGDNTVSGDVLAFLLAISPVAATFAGYSIEKLQRSCLTTFFGLMMTGATSLVAAFLYLRKSPSWLLPHVGLGQVQVNIGVFVAGFVGILTAIYLYWRLRDEMAHYVDLLMEKNTVGMMFR